MSFVPLLLPVNDGKKTLKLLQSCPKVEAFEPDQIEEQQSSSSAVRVLQSAAPHVPMLAAEPEHAAIRRSIHKKSARLSSFTADLQPQFIIECMTSNNKT